MNQIENKSFLFGFVSEIERHRNIQYNDWFLSNISIQIIRPIETLIVQYIDVCHAFLDTILVKSCIKYTYNMYWRILFYSFCQSAK